MTAIAISGRDLNTIPQYTEMMFRDRAKIFGHRLGWDVTIDGRGYEMDQYDVDSATYLILTDQQKGHIGSTRLISMSEQTMLKDYFAELFPKNIIDNPRNWETTRLFIARSGPFGRRATSMLMWAGCRFALLNGIEAYLGVADEKMVRVYKSAGWEPEVLARECLGGSNICGLQWHVNKSVCDSLRRRAGIKIGEDSIMQYENESDEYMKRVFGKEAASPANSSHRPPYMGLKTANINAKPWLIVAV